MFISLKYRDSIQLSSEILDDYLNIPLTQPMGYFREEFNNDLATTTVLHSCQFNIQVSQQFKYHMSMFYISIHLGGT